MKLKDIYKMYLLAKLQNVKVYVKTLAGIKSKIIKCKVIEHGYGIYNFNKGYMLIDIKSGTKIKSFKRLYPLFRYLYKG